MKLKIQTSGLPNAGLGLFTEEYIPEGVIIPHEYKGEILDENGCEELDDRAYMWELDPDETTTGQVICIDARRHVNNNYLRYVNAASTKEQCKKVNLEPIQVKDKMFYKTTRPVVKNTELIVDYGSEYFTTANGEWFECSQK